MTDIANEPDDQMSMVRFLVYAQPVRRRGPGRDDVDVDEEQGAARRHPHACSTPTRRCSRTCCSTQPGFPTADALRARGRRRASRATAWPRSGADKMSRRRRADRRAPPTRRRAAALGARLGRHQHAGAGAARTRSATRTPAQLDALVVASCASTRSPIRTTPGRGCGASSRRCTTSRCRRRRTARSTTCATWTGISGDRFYRNAPGADFTTFTDAWVNANIRSKGPLGKLYPYPVLHPRGRHAVVPRPDRQRPRRAR